MVRNLDCVVRELVDRGLARDVQDRFSVVVKCGSLPAPVRTRLTRLFEELSDGDWQKWGVVFGLLWYKFDRLLGLLSQVDASNKGVERAIVGLERGVNTLVQLQRVR